MTHLSPDMQQLSAVADRALHDIDDAVSTQPLRALSALADSVGDCLNLSIERAMDLIDTDSPDGKQWVNDAEQTWLILDGLARRAHERVDIESKPHPLSRPNLWRELDQLRNSDEVFCESTGTWERVVWVRKFPDRVVLDIATETGTRVYEGPRTEVVRVAITDPDDLDAWREHIEARADHTEANGLA